MGIRVNQSLKCFLTSTPGFSALYFYLKKLYLQHLKNVRCRRLRRYGGEILEKVYRCLENDVKYYAAWGTLLGLMREQGFIRHDDDVDFIVCADSVSPKHLFSLIDGIPGFSFLRAFEFRGHITELTFLYQQIEVDFFFGYQGKDGFVTFAYAPQLDDWQSSSWRSCCLCRPIQSMEVEPFSINGMHAMVPIDTDGELTCCYGQWREPVSVWNCQETHGQTPRVFFSDMAKICDERRVQEIGDFLNLDVILSKENILA